MELILTKHCKALQGTLVPTLGYFIVKRGDRFFSVRSGHGVKNDDHWKFIVACAELAHQRLYIADIRVSGYELKTALTESSLFYSALKVDVDYEYSAEEVLNFKTTRGL